VRRHAERRHAMSLLSPTHLPPPKRARKCPHCGDWFMVRAAKLFFEEALFRAEGDRRFKEGRKAAARAIRDGRNLGDYVVGIQSMVSSDD
jgi:hypothetical protein